MSIKPLTPTELAFKTNQIARLKDLITPYNLVELCIHSDPDIARNAQALLKTKDSRYLEVAVDRWYTYRYTGLLKVLEVCDYLPNVPYPWRFRYRLTLALKLNKLKRVADLTVDQISYLLRVFDDHDPEIVDNARRLVARLERPEVQQRLWEMVIEHEQDDKIERAIVKAGFLPPDPEQKVLFYFLTRQWYAYEKLDFDGRILRKLYQKANPYLKRRIADRVRQTGRIDYLNIINRPQPYLAVQPARFNGGEAVVLVKVLEQNGQWDELGALICDLPPHHSIQLMQKLTARGWQPANSNQQELFGKLKRLATAQALLLSLRKIRESMTTQQWQALDWTSLIAHPLANHGPEQLAALLKFKKAKDYAALPSDLHNTIEYIEAALLYRLPYAVYIEESIEPAPFDIELSED